MVVPSGLPVGSGLGLAAARRFGREGFGVALVARNRGKVDGMVSSLAGEGIQAAGFAADLTERAGVLRAVDAIEARFGPTDVLQYSPGGDGNLRRQASQIDVSVTTSLVETFVMTPVALVSRVLPGMIERGNGGLLFVTGVAGKYPIPHLASAGMALSGLRSYAHNLHAELAPSGIYAGALVFWALIDGTPAHRNAAAWGSDIGPASPVLVPVSLSPPVATTASMSPPTAPHSTLKAPLSPCWPAGRPLSCQPRRLV